MFHPLCAPVPQGQRELLVELVALGPERFLAALQRARKTIVIENALTVARRCTRSATVLTGICK